MISGGVLTEQIFIRNKTVDDLQASLSHLPFLRQAFIRLVVKVEEDVVYQKPAVCIEGGDPGWASAAESIQKEGTVKRVKNVINLPVNDDSRVVQQSRKGAPTSEDPLGPLIRCTSDRIFD